MRTLPESVRQDVIRAAVVPQVDPPTNDRWRRKAACAGKPTGPWFAERNQPALRRAALAICEGCPVRHPCLEHAIAAHEDGGIWGGLTAAERESLRRRRSRAARMA